MSDAVKARGLREGENPARWRGHLALLMPERRKLSRGHHAALPYEDAAAFYARLQAAVGMGARALEFLLFTLGRESEVLGARWVKSITDTTLEALTAWLALRGRRDDAWLFRAGASQAITSARASTPGWWTAG